MIARATRISAGGDGKPELLFRDHVQPDFVVKAESCFRCGINCHKNVYEKNADGTRGAFLAKFDYEPVNLLSTNIGIHDPRKAATLISLVDRLGWTTSRWARRSRT